MKTQQSDDDMQGDAEKHLCLLDQASCRDEKWPRHHCDDALQLYLQVFLLLCDK